jgi:hypothetical protein
MSLDSLLRLRAIPTLAAVAFLSAYAPTRPVSAADDYKKGDMIEVFHLGEWRPATVIEVDKRGNVGAEYEFAGRPHRQAFKAAEVRAAFESGAMARGRMWSDTSGKFRVKAALLKINEDDSVTIRKDDMSELKIPLKNLSEGDNKYIKTFKKEAAAVAAAAGPTPPPLEDFSGGAFGSFGVPFAGSGAKQEPLAADPLPAYLKMKQGGVAFPLEEFFDKLGAVLPLGGPDSWILAALESSNPSKPVPTRLLWASIAKQKVEGRQLLPGGEMVLDYHPPTRRLLTYAAIKEEGRGGWGIPALTLWEVSPSDKEVKPIVRWKAGDDRPHDPWARIIDGNLVVQRFEKQEYVCWDTSAKQVKYRLNQESFFAPLATLSGGRKYLFLPEDKGVRVIESATGKLLVALEAPNGASGVALSEDGRRLAVLEDYVLAVHDLTDPSSEPQRYQADAIGTPFSADLYWVGEYRVMCDKGAFGQVLFSLDKNIALWNYHFDGSAVREHGTRRLREIVDQHLVYAASVGSGQQRGLAVGAVQLPGPKVEEVAAATDPDSLLIMKPGSEVRIQVSTGQHDAKVRDALLAQIEKIGWVHSESAEAVFVAEMKRGEQQNVTYTKGGFGRSESSESVSVTPFVSSLVLKLGDKVLWQSGTSTGAPPVLFLRDGQTAQGEVNKWQNPDPDFFSRVKIPDKLIDPDKRNGLGTTDVTNRGLIAK